MKLRRIVRGERVPPGLVLTRDAAGLPKGRLLSEADARQLEQGSIAEIRAVELEPGDLHEEEAGRRLARAAAGEGVEAQPPAAGSFPLAARYRGLLEVDAARLAQVNLVEDLALYSHPHHFVASQGEIVARAKIVPFVTSEERVRKAEEVARGVVRVRPFLPLRCALLVQEDLAQPALESARASFEAKLAFFGATLEAARLVEGSQEALARALDEERARGAQMVLVAGSRSMDPFDSVLRGVESLGAKLVRHGVPAYPGTLLWLAYLGDVAVLGAPSCGIFTRASALDVVLPRLMTGERLGVPQLAELAVGGLIVPEVSYRLAPYRPGAARGQLE